MVYKQLPNIKQYNRNGSKIDPFCVHKSQQVIYYDYDVETGSEVERPLYGFYLWSSSLEIYTYSDSAYDENDNFLGYNQQIQLGINLQSSDNSLNISYEGNTWDNVQNEWIQPYIDITSNLDVRSDDSSVSVISKTDSQTNAQYFDLSVTSPTLPSVQSSDETVNVSYNSSTKVYDVKSDLRSDNSTIYIEQKTDANTNDKYLNIDVNKAEAQSLMTNGLIATGFSINYRYQRLDASTGLSWYCDVNTYIPLFKIRANNLGKSSIIFEIIGREDTFGYYAKYYFSSRKLFSSDQHPAVTGTGYPAGLSGTTYTDDQNQTHTYPNNYCFLGNCTMIASDRTSVFDPADVVVVERGSSNANSNEVGPEYLFFRKNRNQVLSPDFYALNVLCYDNPGYCDIKFYFCSPPVHKYNNMSLFPSTGAVGELYLDTTNKKVYKWGDSSNEYYEYSSKFNYRYFDNAFLPFEAVVSNTSSPYTTVGLTTFTDKYTGETKNIADYAVSATFPSNNP